MHSDDRLLRWASHDECCVTLTGVVGADQVRVHIHQPGKQRVPGEIDAPGVVGGIGCLDYIGDASALDDHCPISEHLPPLGVDQPVRRENDALDHAAKDTVRTRPNAAPRPASGWPKVRWAADLGW